MDRECLTCGRRLGGLLHGNRRYCSLVCRRHREMERRAWDARKKAIAFYERNADLPCRTPRQRRTWLRYADEVRRTLDKRP